jgi:hypothetical protein
VALLLACLPVAQAQESGAAYEIRVRIDTETGEKIASSVGNSDTKLRQGYSPAAQSAVVMWVEARLGENGPPRMYLVAQRLRYTLPKETKSRGKFGSSDPKDPAYVGTPFRNADLKTRWTEITCISDAYYCSRIDEHEIALSDEIMEAFAASDAADMPVALTRKNRIDWRVPRWELVETLRAVMTPQEG